MASVPVDPSRVHAFADRAGFEAWLAANHDREPEVWITIRKKGSGLVSITPDEAIDAALCWGWIDAIRKGLDETSFLQRYTPRSLRSVWSQVNVAKVDCLMAEGRMRPPGLAQVDAAKSDGRWGRAYRIRGAEPAPDLAAAIGADAEAVKAWAGLTSQNRFAVIFRVEQMKTPAGRARKIAAMVAMLARGETPHPQKARP